MPLQRRLAAGLALAIAVAVLAPAGALAQAAGDHPGSGERRVLEGYAADTWRSFELLVDPGTGLPSDNVAADGTRSRYTSPTNVGTYLWSTLAARDLDIIRATEARARISRTLDALASLERHTPSGMFYNWYDPATGAKLTTWPVDGSPVYPFLSTVDNGWLAAALLMVRNAVPQLAGRAAELLAPMDFGAYYDPAAGLLRGGFWVDPPGTTCTSRTAASSTPATTTAASTPSRGSPATSGSPSGRCRPPTTSRCGGPSPTPATGAGRSSSPPGSPAPTWASRCSRATTATAAWTSCPAGAGACSRP